MANYIAYDDKIAAGGNFSGTAATVEYDNTTSGLTATNTQNAIDELSSGKVNDNLTFSEASTRANITSGESFSTILGKIKKFFTDLKTVAFSGSYNDLSNTPTIPSKTSQLTNDSGYITTDTTKVSKSGDTMTGGLTVSGTTTTCLTLNPKQGNFSEGLRINAALTTGYFTILMGGATNSVDNTTDGAFWIGGNRTNSNYFRKLYIGHNASTASDTFFYADAASRYSPALHLGWGGAIITGDQFAVKGETVYDYIASGKSDRDAHDANTCLRNGFYYYTANGPATSIGASTTDGALYVQQYSDVWVAQIAQDYRNGNLFVRGKNNGTWQAWKAIIHSGNIGSQSTYYSQSAGKLSNGANGVNYCYLSSTDTILTSLTSGGGTCIRSYSGWYAKIQADGNLVVYNSSNQAKWSSGTSSKRFKHNIQDMTEERAKSILNVRPVTFDWNDDQPITTRQTDNAGVIAEELADICPDLVVFENNDNEDKVARRIEYERFTPYLIKMIQIQQKEIDELRSEINKLKNT